ncbi:MAG: type II toxin-antitoxin system Phd/YefM family antitoxin [Desulfobacteraceae bacterium]|nr:type II toxin-antitoxin system Phd/YefM family antitoxin [Desulfobacteraceae bacterium]
MSAALTTNNLRDDMDELFEGVLKTGIPLEIEYKGKKFMISIAGASEKLSKLRPHPDCITGNPEDIVHMDWTS